MQHLGIMHQCDVPVHGNSCMPNPATPTPSQQYLPAQGPNTAVVLWSVPARLRPFAMSLQVIIIHVLGDVPSPVLLGWLQERIHNWRCAHKPCVALPTFISMMVQDVDTDAYDINDTICFPFVEQHGDLKVSLVVAWSSAQCCCQYVLRKKVCWKAD